MTHRDAAAKSLDDTLNLAVARTDAPLTLPNPVPESLFTRMVEPLTKIYNSKGHEPLSGNQRSQLSLALACDLQVTDPALHPVLHARHDLICTQGEADEYIKEVDAKISSKRLR